MKKLILILIIFLSVGSSFAQEYSGGMITSMTETILLGTSTPNSDIVAMQKTMIILLVLKVRGKDP